MAKLYITEYVRTGRSARGGVVDFPEESPIATQVVTFTGTAATSAALNSKTTFVRVVADAAACVAFGTNPSAVGTDPLLPANSPEYRGVPEGGGFKISAITA